MRQLNPQQQQQKKLERVVNVNLKLTSQYNFLKPLEFMQVHNIINVFQAQMKRHNTYIVDKKPKLYVYNNNTNMPTYTIIIIVEVSSQV